MFQVSSRRRAASVALVLLLFVVSATLCAGESPAAYQGKPGSGIAAVSLALREKNLVPGAEATAVLTLVHEEGWHSYGADPGSAGLPTQVTWTLPSGFEAGPIEWPAPKVFVDRGVSSTGHDGRLELPVRIRVPADLAPGGSATIAATVSWLACRESCVPGKAELSLELPVRADTAQEQAGGLARLLLMLALAFAGGLVLNLMPCVLPVLGLKVHGLMLQAGMTRRETLRSALAYTLGILLSFWALAGLLALLSSGGRALGWGFQYQSPAFVAGMAVFLFIFALNMLGVFELGAGLASGAANLEQGEAARLAKGKRDLRSLLSGFLATLAATPCSAPFMGTAMGFALSTDPMSSFLVFGAMGLGLASPVVLLGAFPGLVRRIPKAARWTESLRQLLGFALLATVLWLLSVLGRGPGATGAASPLMPTLLAMLGAGLGAWVLGRWGGFESPRRRKVAAGTGAVLLFALALGYAVLATGPDKGATAVSPNASEVETPGAFGLDLAADGAGEGEKTESGSIAWRAFSPESLAAARAGGKAVFIDFTADWCLTCKANEAAVLDRPKTAELFARTGVVALRADWTRADPAITGALAGYGRSSVPLYVVYRPGSDEPLLLPEILTFGALEKALDPARGATSP